MNSTCSVRLLDAYDSAYKYCSKLQVDAKTSLESLLDSALIRAKIPKSADHRYECVKLEQYSKEFDDWMEIDASGIASQLVENGASYIFTLTLSGIRLPSSFDKKPGNRASDGVGMQSMGGIALAPRTTLGLEGEWVNSFGSRAELGDYYGADSLTYRPNQGALNGRIRTELLKDGTKNGRLEERFFFGGDHFAELGITSEEKLNVLAGMRPVSGAEKFLLDFPSLSTGKHIVSAIYKLQYKAKQLEMTSSELSNLDQHRSGATHLIKSIVYGGVFVFSFILDDPQVRYSAYTEGELRKMIIESIHVGHIAVDSSMLREKMKVRVFADDEFNLLSEMTIDQAISAIGGLSRIVEQANGGVPILYKLLQLEAIDRTQHHHPINHTISNELISLLAEMSQVAARIRAIASEVDAHLYCLPDSARGAVADLHKGGSRLMEIYQEFVAHSAQLIKEIRAMDPPPNYFNLTELESAKDEFMRRFCDYFDSIQYPVMERVERARQLHHYGITFILPSDETRLQNFLLSHRECLVLFWSDAMPGSEGWNMENEKYFIEIVGEPNEGESREVERNFAFVDLTLTTNLKDSPKNETEQSDKGSECSHAVQENCFDEQVDMPMDTSSVFEEMEPIEADNEEKDCSDDADEPEPAAADTDPTTEEPSKLPANTCIVRYRDGVPVCCDCLADRYRKQNACIAKCVRQEAVRDGGEASSSDCKLRIPLEITCPHSLRTNNGHSSLQSRGESSCLIADRRWECDECGMLLEFNKKDSLVYCDCGKARLADMLFRCDSNSHDFVAFEESALVSVLEQMRTFGEKNVLILGETGVGKSTWINAFANYLTYASMEEALDAEKPICLIPSRFSIPDKTMRDRVVKIGEVKADDPNEQTERVGESATLYAKAHVFPYRGGTLRLIDTPGIGDTAGTEQDKRNFDNTLKYLANLKEIHGICILLKPNTSRLTIAFKYCLSELLTHLHKDAAKNLIFCFTNARGTLYTPGDTLEPLKSFLSNLSEKRGITIRLDQGNVYCMDNEAFRFIWAVKSRIQFTVEQHKAFSESWKTSEQETNRLLKHILSLPPHKTMETVSLNDARRIIVTLAQPLAMISQTIQSNITAIADRTSELENLDASSIDFRRKLQIPEVYIATSPLPYPRTVCVAAKCTSTKKGSDGKVQTVYHTHCHPHCYLTGVVENLYPNPDLTKCDAMHASGGVSCYRCGCGWNFHMHIRYEQMERTRMIDDPTVAQMLKSNADKEAILIAHIDGLESRRVSYLTEQKRVNEIAARFGSFLKQNAIMPYNDAIRAYVELAIREAQRIADETDDYRKVEGLRRCLAEYEEQKRMIEQCLAMDGEKIEAFDIKQYYAELIALPLTGENIKELYEMEQLSQLNQMKYTESEYNAWRRRAPRSSGGPLLRHFSSKPASSSSQFSSRYSMSGPSSGCRMPRGQYTSSVHEQNGKKGLLEKIWEKTGSYLF